MTPTLAVARNPKKTGLRKRDVFKIDKRRIYKRTAITRRVKQMPVGSRVLRASTETSPSSSWICTSTSWTDVKMYRNPSEICTDEFASWTILDEDLGNDEFLGECMRLYWSWTVCEEEEKTTESSDSSWLWSPTWCDEETCGLCEILQKEDQLEEGMELFAMWTAVADDDDEVTVEPEMHDSLLMAALLSTKDSPPSAGALRGLSCPDLLMDSPAVLLFKALPPLTKWIIALETLREMDPPNSISSTVSLPSGWDAVSARLSTSSVFNLFSDRVPSPIPSLFSIDPTGVASTGSTVSVPPSFWDTPSTVSVTGSAPTSTIPSSTSSVLIDPSEVSSSSSISTLFMDPSSAHSCSSIYSSSSHLTESLSSSSSLSSICPDCKRAHSYQSINDFDDESTDDEFERSRHTYIVSNSSSTSDYETDSDGETVVFKKMTTAVSTQTEEPSQGFAARMLAECDEMLEKLVEMKKKLREML